MSASDPEREGGPDAEHQPSEEPAPLDIDTAFAAIVAGWGEDPPDTAQWPALENLRDGERPSTADQADAGFGLGQEWPDASGAPMADAGRPPIGLPEVGGGLEPEEFVPPDPGPLPKGDALSRTAWAGVIGGPLFLLIAVIAWRSAPQLLLLAAIVAFVGGFVVLVSRMPKHREDDDDDGAVV
jgi:hypothetical protein